MEVYNTCQCAAGLLRNAAAVFWNPHGRNVIPAPTDPEALYRTIAVSVWNLTGTGLYIRIWEVPHKNVGSVWICHTPDLLLRLQTSQRQGNTVHKAEAIVTQYNQELAEWEEAVKNGH